VGLTSIGLTVHFEAQSDIELVTGAPFLASDRFRFLTVESSFASPSQFDANVIEYVDPQGVTNIIRLNELTPRDAHLFPSASKSALGLNLLRSQVPPGIQTAQACELTSSERPDFVLDYKDSSRRRRYHPTIRSPYGLNGLTRPTRSKMGPHSI
jgi:hypothetical protein